MLNFFLKCVIPKTINRVGYDAKIIFPQFYVIIITFMYHFSDDKIG